MKEHRAKRFCQNNKYKNVNCVNCGFFDIINKFAWSFKWNSFVAVLFIWELSIVKIVKLTELREFMQSMPKLFKN